MKDNYNRDINYLRLALTSVCNLSCDYCMPKSHCSIKKVKDLSYDEFINIVEAASELGINKIRLTGGEPLLFPKIIPLIKHIKNIPGIKSVHLSTNGILLQPMAAGLVEAGLDSINISLDSIDSDKYKNITRGGSLQKVLDGIKSLEDLNFKAIKINTVLMKGVNDMEVDNIINWAIENSKNLRFIELMPIGEGQNHMDSRSLLVDEIINSNPLFKNIKPNIDGTSLSYSVDGSKAKIGFITPLRGSFCNRCNKIRINSTGQLRKCLMSNETVSLKRSINNKQLLIEELKNNIASKPKTGKELKFQDSCMYTIGG